MQPVWEWGIAVIEWLQPTAETAGVAASWLDALFVGISSLDAGETYLLLIPLVIWCVSYRLGVGLLLLFLVSSELNLVLKEILQHPRPFELVPELHRALLLRSWSLLNNPIDLRSEPRCEQPT